MEQAFESFAHAAGLALEVVGIFTIVAGVFAATIVLFADVRRRDPFEHTYRRYRKDVGRAILLGLELLVAADIIGTVAVEPTFRSVGVLAVIVAIRTFLSFSLELEVSGRWPWQRESEPAVQPGAVGMQPQSQRSL